MASTRRPARLEREPAGGATSSWGVEMDDLRPEWIRRFREKVQFTFGCWIWTGNRSRQGYGRMKLNGKYVAAHRVGYMLVNGPIPEGLELDHLCRNRGCVNPYHNEPVSHRVNMLRGNVPPVGNFQKTTCPNGHPYDMVWADGKRRCRVCRQASWRRAYHRRRALLVGQQTR